MSFLRHSLRWGSPACSLHRRPTGLQGVVSGNTGIRCMSSTPSPSLKTDDAAASKQQKLGRTLYRQLIRWCQATDDRIPLSFFIQPTVIIQPPQVDEGQLKALHKYNDQWKLQQKSKNGSQSAQDDISDGLIQRVHEMLPPKCHIEHDRILVSIRNASELKNLLRAVHRLNSAVQSQHKQQHELVSLAFQALRSLNELTSALDELNEHRQSNSQRSDEVSFKVGQVVRHKLERWRGVVAGWEEPKRGISGESSEQQEDTAPLTSLTTKTYSGTEYLNSVRYEVILDAGDMHLMQASTPIMYAIQSNLELVQDERLSRIRSNMCAEHFKRFDANSKCFVPSDMLAYEFPADVVGDGAQQSASLLGEDAANECVEKIKAFARHLEQCMPSSLPDDRSGELKLLVSFRDHLVALASGEDLVIPLTESEPHHDLQASYPSHGHDDDSRIFSASMHLRLLLTIMLEVRDMLSHRHLSKQTAPKLKFALGDIVYHKFFQFRGVVVACDHKPTVDVSHWDGVRHIENPLEKPFYHVIPDQNDCVTAFGSERGLRYVCEENLEPCDKDRQTVNVDLEKHPDWVRTLAPDGTNVFQASIDAKFKHGDDIGDESLTETILHRIQDEITFWQIASRDTEGTSAEDGSATAGAPAPLKLSTLFKLLKAADKLDDAIPVEETIKEMWKAHKSSDLRLRLDIGITDVIRGRSEKALASFQALTEEDSTYAEAWNKISACEYMLGNQPASLAAAEKTLALVPLHFQALNGVGLVYFEQGNYDLAAASFQKSIELDPWSPISSKLAVCLDLLENNKSEDGKKGPDDYS